MREIRLGCRKYFVFVVVAVGLGMFILSSVEVGRIGDGGGKR